MKNLQTAIKFVTPSWLVNFIGITAGVLITGATIVLARYQGSQLHQEIFETPHSTTLAAPGAYKSLTANIANNHLLGVAPLFIVWACVGLVVYYFTIAIAHSLGQAANLRQELNYVNVSRHDVLRQSLMQLAVRLGALIAWFVFIKLSISVTVPYALTLGNIAGVNANVMSIAYALLAIVVVYVDVYGHMLFLRLIALKPRLLSH